MTLSACNAASSANCAKPLRTFHAPFEPFLLQEAHGYCVHVFAFSVHPALVALRNTSNVIKETVMRTCVSIIGLTALLAACGSAPMHSAPVFSQDALPEPIKVPAGHKVAMETVGVGDITYECREKKDAAGQFEWIFAGPAAVLKDRGGKAIGSYYGPPATWQSSDGSKITATQLAVAPAGAGNIALQLVKANPASGAGAMMGVTYIQRVATKGGVAPASACDAAAKGKKEVVKYQADYIFWKAV
jgi:hypothetical protein